MSNPIHTAGLYPIFGLLHIFTHPKSLTNTLKNTLPNPSKLLLPAIVKTLLFTCLLTFVSIFSLYHITDHLLYLLTRNSSIFPFSLIGKHHFLRSTVALLTVAVQAALIAGQVVQYFIGEGARRVGSAILLGGVLTQPAKDITSGATEILSGNTGNAKNMFTSTASSLQSSTTTLTSNLQSTTTSLASNVQSGVTDVAKDPAGTVRSLEKKVENTISKKGMNWAIMKAISVPVEAIPLAGPVVYAALNSSDLGKNYIQDYAKTVGVEKELEMNMGSVKAFGLVAGVLRAIPIVGPLLNFSNFIGSALFVSDLKAYKVKEQQKRQ